MSTEWCSKSCEQKALYLTYVGSSSALLSDTVMYSSSAIDHLASYTETSCRGFCCTTCTIWSTLHRTVMKLLWEWYYCCGDKSHRGFGSVSCASLEAFSFLFLFSLASLSCPPTALVRVGQQRAVMQFLAGVYCCRDPTPCLLQSTPFCHGYSAAGNAVESHDWRLSLRRFPSIDAQLCQRATAPFCRLFIQRAEYTGRAAGSRRCIDPPLGERVLLEDRWFRPALPGHGGVNDNVLCMREAHRTWSQLPNPQQAVQTQVKLFLLYCKWSLFILTTELWCRLHG